MCLEVAMRIRYGVVTLQHSVDTRNDGCTVQAHPRRYTRPSKSTYYCAELQAIRLL